MRRIDFRGQRLDTKEWTYGCLLITELKGNLEPLHYFICPIKNEGMHRVMPETVGQFTGLHDKNGKEIYEGDIVTYPDASSCGDSGEWDCFTNMGVVDYCVNTMSYYFTNRVSVDMDEIDIEVEVEIIGNIYDNPELLKEASHE